MNKQTRDRLQAVRSVLTFCFGIGYIANVFLAQSLLALINTITLILAVILSFIATKGPTRMIAAVLFIVGAFLTFTHKLLLMSGKRHSWRMAICLQCLSWFHSLACQYDMADTMNLLRLYSIALEIAKAASMDS